jgi:DNA invertase Pin-like site-specific DNA recombinase
LQGRASRSYEEFARKMYDDYILWMSRHEIADKYNIPYTTTCFWLRKKSEEMENVKFNVHEKPLLV